ncbi:hypothetical protein CDEST_13614 [Colletotrichum destructivum]|uniref:Uncharacterized protein n=1 Tax=Colletotrichum destructivum TaxID=34406 RepID=A0AAX4IZH6_9PEZI|nr:hypothetical protein CDEST_13614 [Colletotrichum destructivum]
MTSAEDRAGAVPPDMLQEADERGVTHKSPVGSVPATQARFEPVTSVRLVRRNQSQRDRRNSTFNEVAAWRASRDRGSSIG